MNGRRILVVSTNADLAGAPLHVLALVKAIGARCEWEFVFGEHGPVERALREMGYRCFILQSLRSRISIYRDFLTFFRLLALMRASKPSLVHAHSSKAGLVARVAGRVLRVPVLYTVHGWGWRGLGPLSARLVQTAEWLCARIGGGRFIYVAREVEDEGRRRLGLGRSQGRVVPNGVPDPATVSETSGRLKAIMVARVCDAKDHECAVRAFELSGVEGEFILCGGGTDSPKFASLVKCWAPVRWRDVKLLGSRSDVLGLLLSSNVFVLASKFEAMPLSILEAMSVGLPVVSSRVGGVPEIVDHGATGLLIDVGDSVALASAMRALDSESLRAEMGAAARAKFLSRFGVDRMASEVLEAYEWVLQGCEIRASSDVRSARS
jgi:glycosyltransferase involved in cell wall biosynthesis